MLVPQLITSLRDYDRSRFLSDCIAGVIVGIVALPLAIAFAIASGVTPDRGLWTAVIAGFLISAIGGSRVQIGGPTGAFVVIVYGIVQQHGIDGLIIATMMAGAILVALGVARLGNIIKFIPYPVTVGFTSGIAVIIFTSQINDLLGLGITNLPADFVLKWRAFAENIDRVNPWAAAVSAGCLLVISIWSRVSKRLPGALIALLLATVAVSMFKLPVETIASRFGELPSGLPAPRIPLVDWETLTSLVGPAMTIAALGAIESLLSAVVADGMIGGRHRSNVELLAQGVANIVTPIFGGIPATGAIARTATNVKNGGRTPVAGIVHALTLLTITLFFGKYAGLIPMAALAAILVVVSWHMSEWRTFRDVMRAPRSDVLVLLITFLLTVLIDLTVAIQAGMVLAAFLFMKRMADVTDVTTITGTLGDPEHPSGDESGAVYRRTLPKGVEVYEINGPFFFGAADAFSNAVGTVGRLPRVLIIRLRNVPTMDATGLHALNRVIKRANDQRTQVILTELQAQPRLTLARAGMLRKVGVAATLDRAIEMGEVVSITGELPIPAAAAGNKPD